MKTGWESPVSGLRVALWSGGPAPALLAVVVLLGLIVMGLGLRGEHLPGGTSAGSGDAALYRKVIEDVRGGEPYYRAAAREQRLYGYPMRPFVVVRPPLLAEAMAVLPSEPVRRIALGVLGLATIAAWAWRLRREGVATSGVALAGVLLVSGVAPAFADLAYPFHEVWAGLLIALSLALRRPGAWRISLALGLLAALTRELAAPYLLVMAATAWRDGERREAMAWVAALVAVGVALFLHAGAVGAQVRPGDLASQGWLKIGGWPFALQTLRWNAFLIAAPGWLTALVAPLALLGLAMWRGGIGDRLALTVFGYIAAFVFVGRAQNSYWGLLIAPLWPLGLLPAPKALLVLSQNLGMRNAPRAPASAKAQAN